MNIDISKIEPNDYNPNEMTEAEFKECKNEIQHLGTLPKPVIVRASSNGKFIIIDGEHNWRAAKELEFTTIPCEIIQADDIEAMRQTYKRNMHGKFNPVKLGKMFKRAGAGKVDISLRKLAKEYDISEGTVRNALAYLKAQELRNSYAMPESEEKAAAIKGLSIRQVRLYIALPPIIRDKWIDAEADIPSLLTKRDLKAWNRETGKSFEAENWEEYEKRSQCSMADMVSIFSNIYDMGLANKIKANKWEFRQSIEKIEDFLHWEHWTFCYIHREKFWEKIRPYAIHYFDLGKDKEAKKSVRDDFKKLYRLICLDNEFRITPEEFAKIFEDSKRFGCEEGGFYIYPQRHYMEQAIQALLIEKGIITEPADIDKLPDPGEKLAGLEMERKAPDFIKNANLPTELKIIIFDFKPPGADDPGYAEILKDVQEQMISTYEEEYKSDNPPRFLPSAKNLKGKMEDWFKELSYREKIVAMTNEDIAGAIISMTGLYSEKPGRVGYGDFTIKEFSTIYSEEERKEKLKKFMANLVHLDRTELLAIYEIIHYMDFIKAMRSAFGKE